ncbi:MAG: Rab proteins geranylgeranyltransferase component A [Trizodia sp. TS-e1964]|nr:MAG: Rab proteins geranylgeranyltransferase component A [Trizodia sp. TS-e1964]
MESLENTLWDVVIAGTGLQQSLLALALSRSGKRVLHLDKNSFYGGSSAAFSLTEAEEWVKSLAKDPSPSPFTDVLIHQLPQPSSNNNDAPPKLSHSRDYTLTLSPQIIYCRSELLTALLTSQVYKQLQFQAVGSYWLYSPEDQDSAIKDNAGQINGKQSAANRIGNFQRVPNGREDIFADKSIDLKSKGALTKFLRFVRQYKDAGKQVIWRPYAETSFTEFLSSQFNLPPALHNPLLSLTLTPYPPAHTTTQFALPRIARHLESIGVYGPGFASLVQKYGTAAEISQIACRAAAVGGATYLLNQGIQGLGEVTNQESNDGTHASLHNLQQVHLAQGPTLRAKWVVGSTSDIPSTALSSFSSKAATSGHCEESVLRSISILSSPLPSLFVDLSEGGPTPAGAIIMIPSGSLPALNHDQASFDLPPVYLIAHSSDTGECPSKHSADHAPKPPLHISAVSNSDSNADNEIHLLPFPDVPSLQSTVQQCTLLPTNPIPEPLAREKFLEAIPLVLHILASFQGLLSQRIHDMDWEHTSTGYYPLKERIILDSSLDQGFGEAFDSMELVGNEERDEEMDE